MPRIRSRTARLTLAISSLVVVLWGCGAGASTGAQPGQPKAAGPDSANPVPQRGSRPREVVIYFPEPKGASLQAVRRAVPPGGFPIDTAVRALLNGPESGEALLPAVPEGTRLLGLSVTGGHAYLNLSREFSGGADGGGLEPLFAIVNSLTEFPDVTRVFIMVEGRPLHSYRGMEIAGGITRRQDLIASENRVP